MNKTELLAALAVAPVLLPVPALGEGVSVNFLPMPGTTRDAFQKSILDGDGSNSYFEAAVIAATVVDDAGLPIFMPADIASLQASSAGGVSALARIAMRLNGIGVVAEEAAAKN